MKIRARFSTPRRLFVAALHIMTAILFGIAVLPQHVSGQTQWCNDVHANGPFIANGFGIVGYHDGPAVDAGYTYQCVGDHQTWGQNYGGLNTYYTIPGG